MPKQKNMRDILDIRQQHGRSKKHKAMMDLKN
jgi:hypothetical protein